MSKAAITNLSKEQEALLPSYRAKWRAIATLVEPTESERFTAAIKAAYTASNFPEPEIIFYSSPFAAIAQILEIEDFRTYLGRDISRKFRKRLAEYLIRSIERQIEKSLFQELRNRIQFADYNDRSDRYSTSYLPMGIIDCVQVQLNKDFQAIDADYPQLSSLLEALIRVADWSIWGCAIDFGVSVLGLQHDRQKWKVLKELIECGGFLFMFENVCIACDRPSKLLFDAENLLHADSEAALEFPDGYKVYAHHGRELPEGRYCKNDEYIEPGTKVKLTGTGEYGIVVHCWYSQEIHDFDCYIAFSGTSFPDRQTQFKPYILRYAAASLEILTI